MINDLIRSLVDYGINNELITKDDEIYVINRILKLLQLDSYEEGTNLGLSFDNLLDEFINYAVDNNLINDTQNSKDEFDTELMNLFVERPSNVLSKFNYYYIINKEKATNYFYNLSVKSNYVRSGRIKKDIKWETMTEYGKLVITINMSKPEKDPKDIAAALNAKSSSYPKCLLCKENEGYQGRINHPARASIRLIPLILNNHQYFMQYSPYAYFNEHCIILDSDHVPMVINQDTFNALIDFVDYLPHYMIGSNADLPIVGGSILTHNHFQGGRYNFPIFDSEVLYNIKKRDYELEILKWPLSTIRIKTKKKDVLLELSTSILNKWINYDNLELDIISHTNVRHNTITPILRKKDDIYEMYLILRNNRTTDEYPMGIFYQHPEYHNIKKENIGLIEAIGLAILTSRLKNELAIIKDAILNKEDYHNIDEIKKHADWLDKMPNLNELDKDNIDDKLKEYVGITFKNLLEHSGVFKLNDEGLKAFIEFIKI